VQIGRKSSTIQKALTLVALHIVTGCASHTCAEHAVAPKASMAVGAGGGAGLGLMVGGAGVNAAPSGP